MQPGWHLLRKDQYKVQRMKGKDMSRYFRFHALKLRQTSLGLPPTSRLLANKEPRIAKIGRRGLAKRSWMWSLREGKPLPGGVTSLTPIVQDLPPGKGLSLKNALSYITKLLPSDWKATVEQKASSQIMAIEGAKLAKSLNAAFRKV
jgi:hypothetical protein